MIQFTFMSIPIANTQAPATMIEHFDFIWIILLLVIGIMVFLAVKTFNKFEKNQDILFGRLRETENDLATLRGEHNSNCNNLISVMLELKETIKNFGGGK